MSNQQPLTKESLSFITHELRNPLAGNQLYLEMLLKGIAGPLTDKQKDMLEELLQSNNKMIQILEEAKNRFNNS